MPELIEGDVLRGNAFIDRLPADVRARLASWLRPVRLTSGEILGRPGEMVDSLYFPIRSLISTVAQMRNGVAVEVGLSGREGFGSLAIAFESRRSPHTTIVQVSGPAYRLSAQHFLEATADSAAAQLQIRALADTRS